ncbi:anaphase-promoting complex subunit 4 isoform X2 [Manduca sexta]|nr:anaphase-promoting complex subunit 4 isoform X2 [Manduca sexta]
MAWRPDGKALAIGYSTGTVYVVDIEDKEVIDQYELEQEKINCDDFDSLKSNGITCITWAVRSEILESATEYNLYDDASIFLQKIPQNGTYKNHISNDCAKDFKEVKEPTQLNMLLIGYATGYIYITIFGRYPYGTLNLSHMINDVGEHKILDINISDDFSIMQVLYLDKLTNNILLSFINTSVLSAYAEEFFTVAKKHGQITQLMSNLDQTMTSITEAWEHILLEMDAKMAYYAAAVPDGGVSADLLELHMLGSPSDEFKIYLLQKLKTYELKKFGAAVEMSYSTIQKLVLKQLNIVGQSLTYHLAELRGLTRIPDRYRIIGIEESSVSDGIRACCAFLNKCLELQQVIDVSMRNYKAFFRWLFVLMIRLNDEINYSDLTTISQQELSHIAEFLCNFDNVQQDSTDPNQEKQVRFNLERLGQYLQDQELTILPDDDENPWHKFLAENPCLLKDNDTFFSMTKYRKYSLIQQQKNLKDTINKVFDISQKDTAKYFSVLYNVRCYQDQVNGDISNNLRLSQTFDSSEKKFLVAFMNANNAKNNIYFMSVDVKERACFAVAMNYHISSSLIQDNSGEIGQQHVEILDLQFYSAEYLSVLINHPYNAESSVFIQIPIKILLEHSNEFNMKSKSCLFNTKTCEKDLAPLLDQSVYKILDKMNGFRLAVSGGRKVAIVLSKSHRKVKVFEMEVDGDDDEDETLDTTPQSMANSQDSPSKTNATTEDITF